MGDQFTVSHLVGVQPGTSTYSASAKGFDCPVVTIPQSGCNYARFTVPRNDAPLTTSNAPPIAILAAITGTSGAPLNNQTANVSTTAFMTGPQDYWLADPGLSTQELIQYTGAIDSTHFSSTFMRNHAVNSIMMRVTSFVTKYLLFGMTGVTDPTGVGEFVLVLDSPLPANVYLQYLLRGTTYVEDAIDAPWYSSGIEANSTTPIPNSIGVFDPTLVDSHGIPTNGVSIAAGPLLAGVSLGPISPYLQIQYLFTQYPEPDISGISFRMYWRDL